MTAPPQALLGLGLDAGGTQTRWALAEAGGAIRARGHVPGFSGQQAHTASGRRHLEAAFGALRHALTAHLADGERLAAASAGVTGHDASAGPALARHLAPWLGLEERQVQCFNDVELAARLEFAPGAGILVYAGTGSIAWFVDADGTAHHVGGRGGLIGDEGSGYWIAKRALAELWRREDDAPGSAAASVLGQHVFAALGGAGWDATRKALAARERGEMGQLALGVAAAASAGDGFAAGLLADAAAELARLACLLIQRHGPAPVKLAGRAFDLDAGLVQRLRAALPAGTPCSRSTLEVAAAAAIQCIGPRGSGGASDDGSGASAATR